MIAQCRRLLVCLLALPTFLAGAQEQVQVDTLILIAFGDVNLGRAVGQELLKGRVDYPFENIRSTLERADLVFVNLESQLTDQGGETQHPQFELIFCGPPQGALSLRRANIAVVSTANNHAFDYRTKGLEETIDNLAGQGIAFIGTSRNEVSDFEPAILERKNIKVGFTAYAQAVNIPGPWRGKISLFDEERARREIAGLRERVDFVVASYHAGQEYVDRPDQRTLRQMRSLIDAGADVVLGHHPHVPQGIEWYREKPIFYSLGNFVFYQPQREWTQRAFGVELELRKMEGRVSLAEARLIPVKVGKTPSLLLNQRERKQLLERVLTLSQSLTIEEVKGSYVIKRESKGAHE